MTPCTLWTGSIDRDGYGRKGWALAHRIAFEQRFGKIPGGMVIDHLCRARACVNTDHMEMVTIAENTRRGVGPTAINAKKTHCKSGHALDGGYARPDGDGKRQCRICNAAAVRAYKRRIKQEKSA